jgi:hypothetical protein
MFAASKGRLLGISSGLGAYGPEAYLFDEGILCTVYSSCLVSDTPEPAVVILLRHTVDLLALLGIEPFQISIEIQNQ